MFLGSLFVGRKGFAELMGDCKEKCPVRKNFFSDLGVGFPWNGCFGVENLLKGLRWLRALQGRRRNLYSHRGDTVAYGRRGPGKSWLLRLLCIVGVVVGMHPSCPRGLCGTFVLWNLLSKWALFTIVGWSARWGVHVGTSAESGVFEAREPPILVGLCTPQEDLYPSGEMFDDVVSYCFIES